MNTVSSLISDGVLSAIIQIESAGKPNAKAPTSSATGLGQFVNSTWLATVRKHKGQWFTNRTEAQVLALRLDPKCSIEMLARFTEDNARIIGSGWTPGDLYLAHFAGAWTAKALFKAPPSANCSLVFSQAAIAANRNILAGKTCGEVRLWAARKMAAASGKDWVGIYWRGEKPTSAVKTTAKVGGGAIVTGTVIATAQTQGVSNLTIALICAGIVAAGVIGYFIWKRFR